MLEYLKAVQQKSMVCIQYLRFKPAMAYVFTCESVKYSILVYNEYTFSYLSRQNIDNDWSIYLCYIYPKIYQSWQKFFNNCV